MTLTEGYAATSTGAFTLTGTSPFTVTTSGNAAMTWNSAIMALDIAVGLTAGTYPVVLTVSNGTSPDATITFTLTVQQPGGGGTTSPGKSYAITSSASDGATISPAGQVSVSKGGSLTFNFSASSVTIDGRALSQDDVRKGSYTFSNVNSNHTIVASGVGQRVDDGFTVDIGNGGSAEYSTDGSQFSPYVPGVLLQEGYVLRAVADDGYEFLEWRVGTSVYKTAELTLIGLDPSVQIQLLFTEAEDPDNNTVLLIIVIAVIAGLLIAGAAYFILRRRT